MIHGIVNFPFDNTSIFPKGVQKFKIDIIDAAGRHNSHIFQQVKFYQIISPRAYNIHPSDEYGFVCMDKQQNILMIENEIDDLEIPHISTVLFPEDEKLHAPRQTIFYIKNVSDYTKGFAIFFDSYAITTLSKPALNYYINMNKERRRNAKILK